jgi:hypothetical protein
MRLFELHRCEFVTGTLAIDSTLARSQEVLSAAMRLIGDLYMDHRVPASLGDQAIARIDTLRDETRSIGAAIPHCLNAPTIGNRRALRSCLNGLGDADEILSCPADDLVVLIGSLLDRRLAEIAREMHTQSAELLRRVGCEADIATLPYC